MEAVRLSFALSDHVVCAQVDSWFVFIRADRKAATATVVLRPVVGGSLTTFERGQVRVIVDTGSIGLTSGVAQEDGRIGQRVRSPQSRHEGRNWHSSADGIEVTP